jgi:hypothetical protein
MVTIKSVKNSISKKKAVTNFCKKFLFFFLSQKKKVLHFLIILVSFFFCFVVEGTGVRESEPNDLMVKTCFSKRFRKCFLLLFFFGDDEHVKRRVREKSFRP